MSGPELPEVNVLDDPAHEILVQSGFPADADPTDFYFERVIYPEVNRIEGKVPPHKKGIGVPTSRAFAIPKVILIGEESSREVYTITPDGAAIAESANVTDSSLGPQTIVHKGARVTNSTLKTCVVVGSNATLDDAHIASNSVIGERATVVTGIIGANSVLGEDSQVDHGSIGPSVKVGKQSRITSMVGNNTTVGDHARIAGPVGADVTIGNSVHIEQRAHVDNNAQIEDGASITKSVGLGARILAGAAPTCRVPDYGVAVPFSTNTVVRADRATNLTNPVVRLFSAGS